MAGQRNLKGSRRNNNDDDDDDNTGGNDNGGNDDGGNDDGGNDDGGNDDGGNDDGGNDGGGDGGSGSSFLSLGGGVGLLSDNGLVTFDLTGDEPGSGNLLGVSGGLSQPGSEGGILGLEADALPGEDGPFISLGAGVTDASTGGIALSADAGSGSDSGLLSVEANTEELSGDGSVLSIDAVFQDDSSLVDITSDSLNLAGMGTSLPDIGLPSVGDTGDDLLGGLLSSIGGGDGGVTDQLLGGVNLGDLFGGLLDVGGILDDVSLTS